jgi:hypothetical protein
MDDLDNTEAHICHLECRIREMEEELAGAHEYKDHPGNKWAQYDLSNGWVQVLHHWHLWHWQGKFMPCPVREIAVGYRWY